MALSTQRPARKSEKFMRTVRLFLSDLVIVLILFPYKPINNYVGITRCQFVYPFIEHFWSDKVLKVLLTEGIIILLPKKDNLTE